MRDQSCVVAIHQKKALIAGLLWQPLLATGFFRRSQEIRKAGLLADANFCVSVQVREVCAVGFDDYDEGLSKEERAQGPGFSLAALLARKFGGVDTLIFWRVRAASRAGDVAFIVIEGGIPTLDVVCSEREANSMMEYYQSSRERDKAFQIISNDSSVWVADRFVDDEQLFLSKQLKRNDLLQSLPLDYIALSKLLLTVVVLLSVAFGYDYYLATTERIAREAQIAAANKTDQYGAELRKRVRNVGFSQTEMMALLDAVYELPFFINGWAIESASCKLAACQFTYKSVGGYTDQLEASFLKAEGYSIQLNPATPEVVKLNKTFPIQSTGPATWTELTKKIELERWVLIQRQVFSRAGVNIQVPPVPEVWPTGFTGVSPDKTVIRYKFQLSGGVALVESFVMDQEQTPYWEALDIQFNKPTAQVPALQISLQGAYYAH